MALFLPAPHQISEFCPCLCVSCFLLTVITLSFFSALSGGVFFLPSLQEHFEMYVGLFSFFLFFYYIDGYHWSSVYVVEAGMLNGLVQSVHWKIILSHVSSMPFQSTSEKSWALFESCFPLRFISITPSLPGTLLGISTTCLKGGTSRRIFHL